MPERPSQLDQDLKCLEYFNNKKGGYFVDIGAHDGKDLSNTYRLETEYGWKGICVEPLEEEFKKCVESRPMSICINTCIYDKNGTVTFNEVTRGNNYSMLSGIDDENYKLAVSNDFIKKRIDAVKKHRSSSKDKSLNAIAKRPHQYRDRNIPKMNMLLTPIVSSENREYLPTDFKANNGQAINSAFAIYDSPLWDMSLISSRIHLVWITAICGKLETRIRYSNSLG